MIEYDPPLKNECATSISQNTDTVPIKSWASTPARINVSTAPEHAMIPDQRRPMTSERKAQTTRPTKAESPTQIIRNEASAGVVRSSNSSKVGAHNASPTPLVCDSPVN